MPSGLKFVSAKATGVLFPAKCTKSGNTVTYGSFNLAPGQTATVKIVVVPKEAGTLTNNASDSFDNTAPATVTVNQSPPGHHH